MSKELRTLLAKATPTPWMSASKPSSVCGWPVCGELGTAIATIQRLSFPGQPLIGEEIANAKLIPAAVNALPSLLDQIDRLTTDLAASRAREAIVRDECTQYDRNCGLTASDLAERIMRELTAPAALSASEDA